MLHKKLVKFVTRSHRDRHFPGKRAAALCKTAAQNTDRIATAPNWLTDIESIAALRINDDGVSFELVLHFQLCVFPCMRVVGQLTIFTEVLYMKISLNAHFSKSMAATHVYIRAPNFATFSRSTKMLTLSCSTDIQLSNDV